MELRKEIASGAWENGFDEGFEKAIEILEMIKELGLDYSESILRDKLEKKIEDGI